jgi:hypothetical protein
MLPAAVRGDRYGTVASSRALRTISGFATDSPGQPDWQAILRFKEDICFTLVSQGQLLV